MTLRLRLVLALIALMVTGLVAFGFTTYSLYARSQYARLDDQMRSSEPFLTRQLVERIRPEGHHGDHPAGPGPNVPLSTYAELRDTTGATVAVIQPDVATTKPSVERADGTVPQGGRFSDVGSTAGPLRWRVYTSAPEDADGYTVVIAVPLGDVTTALRRLLVIEAGGGVLLVAGLSTGAWVIVRRGLRPLEQMASTARGIAAGDLTRRATANDERSEVGQLGAAFNTMVDEIERGFVEREVTERRLRQFLSDASHELRTPLTSIRGFAELFRIGDRGRIDLPTIMRRIEDESARMKVLVDDLLLLARLDERRSPERKAVDLTVIAADACSDAVAAAPERSVTLHAPGPVVVAGDEALLRQAVANLVTNAVRHTPSGTSIEVGAVRVDGRGIVTVRDHGGGLAPDALDHVFDRFWQADRGRAGTGTGLGLAIVAGVAAEHGGNVTAANGDGGGAVFTITVPVS